MSYNFARASASHSAPMRAVPRIQSCVTRLALALFLSLSRPRRKSNFNPSSKNRTGCSGPIPGIRQAATTPRSSRLSVLDFLARLFVRQITSRPSPSPHHVKVRCRFRVYRSQLVDRGKVKVCCSFLHGLATSFAAGNHHPSAALRDILAYSPSNKSLNNFSFSY